MNVFQKNKTIYIDNDFGFLISLITITMQNVYQPLVSYMAPNESTFQVENPDYFRDGIQRAYSFAYLNIVPDYYSKLADEHNIENIELNPSKVRYPFTIEWTYGPGFYTANHKERIEHTIPLAKTKINELITNINSFMYAHTPNGMKHPPVVIDWVNDEIMKLTTNSSVFDYFTKYGPTLYAENDKYLETTHYNVLPINTKNMTLMTNFKIPTDDDEIENVRLRIHLAPNTSFKISSEALMQILGFTNIERGSNRQFEFFNKSSSKGKVYYATSAPALTFKLTSAATVYVDKITSTFKMSMFLETTRVKELSVPNIVASIKDRLELFADTTYLEVGIDYNDVEKKVMFAFPQNAKLDILLYMPVEINSKLGFDLHNAISKLNYKSTTSSYDQAETQKMFYFSQIITNDTGQIIVTVDNVPSLSSRIERSQIMAALTPKDGCLSMEPNVRPYVTFSERDKYLIFRINRFSEQKEVIPLSWKIGCYINAALEGRPV